MKNQGKNSYFHRVTQQTPTRLWVNNAMPNQAEAALEAGAIGASTNPTYPSKLEKDYLNELIDKTLNESDDDDRIAELVYQKAVARLQEVFMPLYKKTNGSQGQVAIQGDPRLNTDVDAIMEGALRYYKEMDENLIVKVPGTTAGAVAMEKLTSMGLASIATMGFSVDQAIYMAEAYRRGLAKTDKRPTCLITYIAGILEDHLKNENEKQGNPLSNEVIEQAGCAGHRVAFRIYKERNYEAVLIGGGARGLHHFTDLVGGAFPITIGYSMVDELVKKDGPVESLIEAKIPDEVVAQLDKYLPDFGRAYRENSMQPEEFRDFGPVMLFQNAFLKGLDFLLKAIRERKAVKIS